MHNFNVISAAIICLTASCISITSCDSRDKVFGWAACSSADGAPFDLTGGGKCREKGVKGRTVVLTSNGNDMRDAIVDAVNRYDIVVLDGSEGVFTISSTMVLDSVTNKTITGINGAYLRSEAQVTPEMLDYIETNKDKYLDDREGPDGKLHMPVGDFATTNRTAYAYRRALLDYTGDSEEKLCNSGMFIICGGSSNVILSNISFEGTGVFRGLAVNMLRVTGGSHNVWVDHCLFQDPSRCCISIGSAADFVTVNRCVLRYTERSGNHTLGVLISSSDNSPEDEGHLNITIAHCLFENVWSRLPMGRYGHVHLLNNYYDCPGTVGINPRTRSCFLVEGNYFEDGSKAFCRYLIDSRGPEAVSWVSNRYGTDDPVEDIGHSVSMPYPYEVIAADKVRGDVLSDCGPDSSPIWSR